MPITNGKCDCGADAVMVGFPLYVYEGWHTPATGKACRYEITLAREPTGGAHTELTVCPGCGERQAKFRRSDTKTFDREICPKGCP